MSQLYEIVHGIPRLGGDCGFGFQIRVWPRWKEVVRGRTPSRDHQQNWLETVGNDLLDACGYGAPFNLHQDLCKEWLGLESEPTHDNDGPAPVERLYDASRGAIVLSWGDWGLEHISVPGNGCGLDIDYNGCTAPKGGVVLLPHHVDSMQQAYLSQSIYGWFNHASLLDFEHRPSNV